MRTLVLVLVFLVLNLVHATEKHALIIAVGDYPSGSGWGDISSANDVPLIKESLMGHGFKKTNIIILKDKEATYSGIKSAIENFRASLKPGDIAVIHFSGHGQPIWDTDSDEIDGYDEAWIPYDAKATYDKDYYEGERHLRDDELGDMFTGIRNALGKEGQLLLLMDSCHSGTASRSFIGGVHRGSFVPFQPKDYSPLVSNDEEFSIIDREEISSNAAPLVAISGATAGQLNYEYDGVGSLTYAFAKAMVSLPKDCTYRQLFSKIESKMNVIASSQQPTIEGDAIDLKLFKNEYVNQKSYFQISEILDSKRLRIKGGKIQKLLPNTTIFVCEAGTVEPAEGNILAKGKIESSKFNEAIVTLDKRIKTTNEKDVWVFVDQFSYEDFNVKIYFHPSVQESSFKEAVAAFLSNENLGSVVSDDLEAEMVLVNNKGRYELLSRDMVATFEKTRGTLDLEKFKQTIFTYAQGKYLKNLELDNSKYAFEFELIPAEVASEKFVRLLDKEVYRNNNGDFVVRPGIDHVVLKITNTSENPIYFSIVEINSMGKITDFTQSFTNKERYLEPNQSEIITTKPFKFGGPYEKLTLKGFSSNAALDLSSVINRSIKAEGRKNPLEGLIDQSYVKKRGSEPVVPDEQVDGYSFEFFYEIIEKKK